MNKILKIIGLVVLILGLVIVGILIYFYNFYVFKTFRICIGEDFNDTMIPCTSDSFCVELFKENKEIKDNLEKAPEFIKEKLEEVLNAAIFCDKTCKIKNVRGFSRDGLQEIESCNSDEKEIKFEIKGKEGIEILKYLKERGKI